MLKKITIKACLPLAFFLCPFTNTVANDEVITDLASGEPVTLVTASWEAKNIQDRPIVCESHNWIPESQTYLPNSMNVFYHNSLDTDGTVISEQIFKSHTFNDSATSSSTWNISNGEYTGPGQFGLRTRVELASVAGGFRNATRIWFSDTAYQLCTAFPPSGTFIPTGNLPECIDTAPIGDGWGWDGTDSCRILNDDELGFGQCDVHYNNLPIGECVDVFPVGDGWGWNGVYSCEI